MRRRDVLVALATGAAGVGAGCTRRRRDDRAESGTGDDAPTDDTTAERVRPEGFDPRNCEADRPRATASGGAVAADYPDPPATLDRAAVRRYVRSFERAYFGNELIADEDGEPGLLSTVRVDAEVATLRVGTDGVRASVTAAATLGYTPRPSEDDDETPTAIPSNRVNGRADYYVTDRLAARSVGPDWRTVDCFEG